MIIKASELMIGDYIMTPIQKGTVIGKIKEIDISFDAPDVCHITCDVGGYSAGFILEDNRGVKPIHITEDILQKSGFKRKQGNDYTSYKIKPYDDGHIIEVALYDSGIDVFICFIYGKCYLRSIKYFHELQNIIRVITGKELIIKDN